MHAHSWAPPLGALRLVGDGTGAMLLGPDATVLWWCAPDFDDTPLAWRLLDADGGAAWFPDLDFVDAEDTPAGSATSTLLRGSGGVVEVRDGLLSGGDGVLLVRLLRLRDHAATQEVVHVLRLGGFDSPSMAFDLDGTLAQGAHESRGTRRLVTVRADRHERVDGDLHSVMHVRGDRWSVLAVGIDADAGDDRDALVAALAEHDAAERRRLDATRLPRTHPDRVLDSLAVLRACTHVASGAVVAAVTTSLPEAPGADRQFDYRYTWLRDASLSTAVAALFGQGEDAGAHLAFVHAAWGGDGLLTMPMVDVRGGAVPVEREIEQVAGWAGSRPVRVGNAAKDQVQYDGLGILVEAVSVHVQAGGDLDTQTWELVKALADEVARDSPDQIKDSNGIWERRESLPLIDGDLGRWLVLDRALWIARGWRPLTRRRHWKAARDTIRARVLAAIEPDGLLPQAYGQSPAVPDASALMAVTFGLLARDDPRAHRLVDVLLERLGTGAFLYRYPPGQDDFDGTEGAFLPTSFLAVTALAKLGRVAEAEQRLDRMCAQLPRLLSEEIDASTGQLLGNTPLVWSHAELARSIYVLDAARRRASWGPLGLMAWRLLRYASLRRGEVRT